MKKIFQIALLSIGMMCVYHQNGLSKVYRNDVNNNSAEISSDGDDLLSKLENMTIPLVEIMTVDEEEPTCDIVSPPEGAWGSGIANATKVPASMRIIKNGEILYDSGEYINKESGLTIKIRGNTSGNKLNKPYKLKLQKKADLLFRDDKKYKDKDWVLLRTGASLVSPIGFWASELIGQDWTPAHEFVNLYMNGTYRGLYVLCEQVTVNPECRIDVDKTDGYVVECDAYWWTEDIYFPSTLTHPALKFTYKYPDPEDITEERHEAISSDILACEEKIADGTYDEVLDCESFAKWLVAWELLGNGDYAGANMYVVKKDANSKLCMGPMWDFDQSFKILDDWIGIHSGYFYFHHMLQSTNDSFFRAFKDVWDLKGRDVAEALINRINAFADSPEGADYQRSLDLHIENGLPIDTWQPYIGDLEFMRSYTTDFIAKRAEWIDEKIRDESGVVGIDANSPDCQEEIYNMLGCRINKHATGLQIRNGKKVYVKP